MSDEWRPRILVVDDEEIQRNIMKEILAGAKYPVDTAGSVGEAVEKFRHSWETDEPFEVVLTDLKMPGNTDGLELLEAVKEIAPSVEVILMTAFSTVASAVRSMKLGAFEYLPKPFDKDRLLFVVEQAREKIELLHENVRLRKLVDEGQGFGRMVGNTPAMRELFHIIGRAARTGTTCLIRGESGTGKELVARALHSQGPRASHPFLAINCAAIPETLIESELFGHEKGAFTGAMTSKNGRFQEVGEGTIFLDEIGSMKYDLQAKLLRVIQEREFSRVGSSELIPFGGRIIAATAQDLEAAIQKNEFREDLYHRLNVVTLEIPPLRERREDIPPLVDHFLQRCGDRVGREVRGVSPDLMAILESYAWPGNVRELENCIERMLVVSEGDHLEVRHLPPTMRPGEVRSSGSNGASFDGSGAGYELPASGLVLDEVEADLIRQALERSGGKIEPAARLLGITYKTLQYRIKKYELKERPNPAQEEELS